MPVRARCFDIVKRVLDMTRASRPIVSPCGAGSAVAGCVRLVAATGGMLDGFGTGRVTFCRVMGLVLERASE